LNTISLKQNFALKFDNSILITLERWSLVQPIPTNPGTTDYFIKFESDAINNAYNVTINNITYYFGSVDQVRFMFDSTQRVYDPRSGQVFSDFVNVFKTNANSTNTGTLGLDYVLNVTGQSINSDGYPDDYQISLTSIDLISKFTYDPDFFTQIVGENSTAYVFFEVYIDINDLYRLQLLPVNSVIYAYPTQNQVLNVIYDYPAGTVFYCSSGNTQSISPKFYQSYVVIGTTPTLLQLLDVTTGYVMATGRSAINFQYCHNSNNTTRIDPATTNIIDLYLVTQSYYTQYQNWIQDTTGTISEPNKPTINELNQSYGKLQDYKMLSDSLIPNSVIFKPLFGAKAAPALRATVKVVKAANTNASNSEIRSAVLSSMNSYFNINNWNFGDTFYFSELSAYLHDQLGELISSVVLVPNNPTQSFGDLYEIKCAPYEIFQNAATASDVQVIAALTPAELQIR
jgi:hypothetical protein